MRGWLGGGVCESPGGEIPNTFCGGKRVVIIIAGVANYIMFYLNILQNFRDFSKDLVIKHTERQTPSLFRATNPSGEAHEIIFPF